MTFRTGIGYDVHKLDVNQKLIIGGVDIPHAKGCVAHSDGDTLLHAIIDALLGAAALGDIGTHFPDDDDAYKNADSKGLLKRVVTLLHDKGYEIGNIDSEIILQAPKVKPYIAQMRLVIADSIGLDIDSVSVKATTTERLGFEGREEGIAALASVLIYKA